MKISSKIEIIHKINIPKIQFPSKYAFSIAEAMITLLIVSVAMAAIAPIISKQSRQTIETDPIPPNMVAFFNADNCPSGWRPADGTRGTRDLRGRFVRGAGAYKICRWDTVTKTYGKCDIAQTLSVGDTQEDAIRTIEGWVDLDGYLGTAEHTGAFWANYDAKYGRDGGGVALPSENEPSRLDFDSSYSVPGANENRPKNIALLACQKN